jgi:hypothetical protein
VTVVDDPHRGLRPRCGVRHRPHAVSPLGPAGLPQNAAHQYHDRHSGGLSSSQTDMVRRVVRHIYVAVTPLARCAGAEDDDASSAVSSAMAVADARGDLLLVSSSIACLQMVNDVR